ncbi:unnamed protein product, partial [Effrenium voratum]
MLNVTQAELHLAQERLRTQSPTPPQIAPRRLHGVGAFASPREVAEEVAAWAVTLISNRVLTRPLKVDDLQGARQSRHGSEGTKSDQRTTQYQQSTNPVLQPPVQPQRPPQPLQTHRPASQFQSGGETQHAQPQERAVAHAFTQEQQQLAHQQDEAQQLERQLAQLQLQYEQLQAQQAQLQSRNAQLHQLQQHSPMQPQQLQVLQQQQPPHQPPQDAHPLQEQPPPQIQLQQPLPAQQQHPQETHLQEQLPHAQLQPQHALLQPQHAQTQPQHAQMQPQHPPPEHVQHVQLQPQHAQMQPQHAQLQPQHAQMQQQHSPMQPQQLQVLQQQPPPHQPPQDAHPLQEQPPPQIQLQQPLPAQQQHPQETHLQEQLPHAQLQPQHALLQPQHAQTQPQHAQMQPQHPPPEHVQHVQLQPQHVQMQPQHAQLQPQHAQMQQQHAQMQLQRAQMQLQNPTLEHVQHVQLQPQHLQMQPQHAQLQPQELQQLSPQLQTLQQQPPPHQPLQQDAHPWQEQPPAHVLLQPQPAQLQLQHAAPEPQLQAPRPQLQPAVQQSLQVQRQAAVSLGSQGADRAHADVPRGQDGPDLFGGPGTFGANASDANTVERDDPDVLLRYLQEQDEDLDEEARRVANKVAPVPPSRSPPPDTGGTPTPQVEEQEPDSQWANCSIIREVDVCCTATQTSPTPGSERRDPASGKALVTAQEEVRAMKTIVANSKKEILYYNQVLREKNAEHEQELKDMQETMDTERRRSAEDMRLWKLHVKKELMQDPIMAVALHMWEREVTALRTSQAFSQWKRKASQLMKARGMQGKMTLLVTLHGAIRDWRIAVIEAQAQRLKHTLLSKWSHSVEQASLAWGRELEHGLKSSSFTAWSWSWRFARWQRKAQRRVSFSLQRWMYTANQVLEYYTFLAWYESLMEVKLQGFRLQLEHKKTVFLKAVLAFDPEVSQLALRSVFYAWNWSIQAEKAKALAGAMQRHERRPSHLLEKAIAFLSTDPVFKLLIFKRWEDLMSRRKAKLVSAKLRNLGASMQVIGALAHYAHDQSNLLMQSVVSSWRRLVEVQALRRSDEYTTRFTTQFVLSAWELPLRMVAFQGWQRLAKWHHFRKHWLGFFRPEQDLVPIVRAWKQMVKRGTESQKINVQVEKKELDKSWFVSLLCFVYWRLKLRPSAAVVSYVPKLARCQAVAAEKLAEAEEKSVFLIMFHAWRAELLHCKKDQQHEKAAKAEEKAAMLEKTMK